MNIGVGEWQGKTREHSSLQGMCLAGENYTCVVKHAKVGNNHYVDISTTIIAK